MSSKKIKHGYKRVKWLFGKEVEIPEDWNVKKIKELFDFLRTGTNSRKDLGDGNYQYIHYGDIHAKWNHTLNCDLDKIPFIAKSKIKKLHLLINGDIIIADASEDHEGSGVSVVLKNIRNRKIVSGLHTIALRDNNKNTSSDFRTYITSSKFVKCQIIAYVTGISVYGLSKKNLSNILILLPPLHEQKQIASILSNVDSLIESTDIIIEKTERLKKGLMQQLLTKGIGHTKFKKVKWYFGKEIEIPEEWEIKKLKNISKINPERIGSKYRHQKILYVDIGSINYFQIMRYEPFSLDIRPSRAQRIIKKNDVIVSTVRPYLKGFSQIKDDSSNLICSTGFTVIRTKTTDNSELIFQFVKTNLFERNVIRQMEGLAYPAISSKIVSESLIPYPLKKQEREKIASILSGIDALKNIQRTILQSIIHQV